MSKVTLFVRYKKLTLWNKISFWGAVASFIGIPLTLVLYLIPQSERDGGDSFAYFIPQTHLYMSTTEPPSYNDVELFLMHSGKQPLYDIQIKLVDIQKSRQL